MMYCMMYCMIMMMKMACIGEKLISMNNQCKLSCCMSVSHAFIKDGLYWRILWRPVLADFMKVCIGKMICEESLCLVPQNYWKMFMLGVLLWWYHMHSHSFELHIRVVYVELWCWWFVKCWVIVVWSGDSFYSLPNILFIITLFI